MLDNNKIIINTTNNINNLHNSEKYILNHYKFIDDKQFKENYLKIIEASLKEKECVKNYKFKHAQIVEIMLAILILITLIGWFQMFNNELVIKYFVIEIFAFLATWIIGVISFNFLLKENTIVKTDIGKQIYLKLNGLKKYIQDFGKFEDKNLKEIKLWEEYILYAIILNESETLKDQAKEEFNVLLNVIY